MLSAAIDRKNIPFPSRNALTVYLAQDILVEEFWRRAAVGQVVGAVVVCDGARPVNFHVHQHDHGVAVENAVVNGHKAPEIGACVLDGFGGLWKTASITVENPCRKTHVPCSLCRWFCFWRIPHADCRTRSRSNRCPDRTRPSFRYIVPVKPAHLPTAPRSSRTVCRRRSRTCSDKDRTNRLKGNNIFLYRVAPIRLAVGFEYNYNKNVHTI